MTTTAPDGDYLLENVALGYFYEVRFVPPTGSGLAIEWWDDAPKRRSADLMDGLTAGPTVTGIDAQLEVIT